MIKIEATIRPQKLDDVKAALTSIGVKGMTISEVQGFGREKGFTQRYRGTEYSVNLLKKVRVEVVVIAREARVVANAIAVAACTGEVGDGKIWFIPIEGAIRIRTGEDDVEAIS